MPTKRTKVVSTSIDTGRATLECFSNPAEGPQHTTDTLIYDMANLNGPTLLNLAAYGFCAVAAQRYQRSAKDGHPDVARTAQELYNEMVAGDWHPGKRDTASREPTDLMKAIAEATSTPLHVVQHEFETRMVVLNDGTLYTDKAGKPRHFFSASIQKEIAADPAIAPILARLDQERAKATLAATRANKKPSKLSTLFSITGAPETPAEAAN